MASIRNRITNLSRAIDFLENGDASMYPDSSIIAEVEAMVTGKTPIDPLTPDQHEAILKELDEASRHYQMPVKRIAK